MRESPMGLFVGADGRISGSDFRPLPDPVCKIRTMGDSIAFFTHGNDPIGGIYNVDSMIFACLRAGFSCQDTREILCKNIVNTQGIFRAILGLDTLAIDSLFPDRFLFGTIIAERRNSKFIYWQIQFEILMSKAGIILKPDTTALDTTKKAWFLGTINLIVKSFDLSGGTPVVVASKIYKLINRQCTDPSGYTGKPVYILWWKRNGEMKWYGDNNPCKSETIPLPSVAE